MLDREEINILVVQPTNFCNIDCDYCYLPNRHIKNLMSDEVIWKIRSQILDSTYWTTESILLWHAGEPLAVRREWYERTHEILGHGVDFRGTIQFQTNGTLIDESWINLFLRLKSHVGISIDGPEHIHDLHRKDRKGRGTFAQAMRGAQALREAEIPFSNIATVTDNCLDHPDDVFDFFKELAPSRLALNIEEAEGANARSSVYDERALARIEGFFKRIATRAFREATPFLIREVEVVVASLLRPPNATRTSQETEIGRIISIGTTGEVALFSPELLTSEGQASNGPSPLICGNITVENIDDIIAGEIASHQKAQIDLGVAKCRGECEYFDYCLGGAPANKYFEHGDFAVSETWYCRTAKQAVTRGVLAAILDVGALAR